MRWKSFAPLENSFSDGVSVEQQRDEHILQVVASAIEYTLSALALEPKASHHVSVTWHELCRAYGLSV